MLSFWVLYLMDTLYFIVLDAFDSILDTEAIFSHLLIRYLIVLLNYLVVPELLWIVNLE